MVVQWLASQREDHGFDPKAFQSDDKNNVTSKFRTSLLMIERIEHPSLQHLIFCPPVVD